MKPHKWQKEIIAWANGEKIQVSGQGGCWIDVEKPSFDGKAQYRIKPEAPKWPVTRMTDKEILELVSKYQPFATLHPCVARFIIDDAIARACEDGDVVLPKVDFAHGMKSYINGECQMVPASMLEKVAKQVLDECQAIAGQELSARIGQARVVRFALNIPSIIASVKEGKE